MKNFKKVLSLALALIMVLSLVPVIGIGAVAEENVTWTEVSEVGDADTEGTLIYELAKGGNIKIADGVTSLSMAGVANMTVATGTVLDANGCVFTDVSLTNAADGLFNLVGVTATIKNLTVGSKEAPAVGVDQIMTTHANTNGGDAITATWENVEVYATLAGTSHEGAFHMYPAGTWKFTDCDVTIVSNAGKSAAGAYFGRLKGNADFVNCTSNGDIKSSENNTGGFIGKAEGAGISFSFTSCINRANLTYTKAAGSGNGVAGLVGLNANTVTTKVLKCTNEGTITVTSTTSQPNVADFITGTGPIEYAALTGTSLADFAGAGATTEVAYNGVANATELIAALQNGGTIELTQDIAMSGYSNITVADGTVLDGCGYSITGVAVTGKNGLFDLSACTTKGVTLQNLKVTGATGETSLLVTWATKGELPEATDPADTSAAFSPIVTVENVDVTATLSGAASTESGVFGGKQNGNWTFTDCDLNVTFSNAVTANAGAYFGRLYGGATFATCTAAGTLTGAANLGGFVGCHNGAKALVFENCTNSVAVTNTSTTSGHGTAGFVGQTRSTHATVLLRCENEAVITAGNGAQCAEFVTAQDNTTSGVVEYGGLTEKDANVADFANFADGAAKAVLYDWAQLGTPGEYLIGEGYPALRANIAIADGVTIDGQGNTLLSGATLNALFVIAENANVTIKNLNIGSESAPLTLYFGIIYTATSAGDDSTSVTAEDSTMTTTWENVHAYALLKYGSTSEGNSGVFFSGKTYGTHTFIDCSATVTYWNTKNQHGAFVGRNCGTMTFIRCTAAGTVTANTKGAFIGKGDATSSLFIDCVNKTDVEAYIGANATEGTNYFNYTTPQLKAVQETVADGGKQSIRFLAAMGQNGIIDETTAQASPIKFGFTVTAVVDTETKFENRTFTLNNLYEAVTATVDGQETSVTAESLGGAYLAALVLNNVPADGTVTFTVTPWMTYADDADTLTGTTYTVVYENGEFQTANPTGVTNPDL